MEQCPVCEHPVREFDVCCNQCGAALCVPTKVVKVDAEEVRRLTKLADEYIKQQLGAE